MEIINTELHACFVLKPDVFEDSRGFFYESYNEKKLEKNFINTLGHNIKFVQDNLVKSYYGAIRGLHQQAKPFSQSKLIYVVEGIILDVAVDIRDNSPTFGKYIKIELSADNKKQLFIPKGFLHGYSVLSETAIVAYKCDEFYNKENELIINPLDETLAIDWKIQKGKELISEKDLNAGTFNQFCLNIKQL